MKCNFKFLNAGQTPMPSDFGWILCYLYTIKKHRRTSPYSVREWNEYLGRVGLVEDQDYRLVTHNKSDIVKRVVFLNHEAFVIAKMCSS